MRSGRRGASMLHHDSRRQYHPDVLLTATKSVATMHLQRNLRGPGAKNMSYTQSMKRRKSLVDTSKHGGNMSSRISRPVSCPIHAFARSMTPPQPKLADLFISLGVKDAETLNAFVCLMRRNEWLSELAEEGRMTWMQKALVIRALQQATKDRTRQAVTPPRDFCSTNEMHNFLMNINPPLPHLIPFFQRLGIRDRETLHGAARLLGRDASLKNLAEKGMMTPLEAKLVGEAMAEFLCHARKGSRSV